LFPLNIDLKARNSASFKVPRIVFIKYSRSTKFPQYKIYIMKISG
jgi:hypothetical protein